MTARRRALACAPRPCRSCPYARSTPPGVWDETEYAKLPGYDDDPGALAVFHCHAEHWTGVPTVCRGWLGVHVDGVAVRVGLALGLLDLADVEAVAELAPDPSLFASGAEAAAVGASGIAQPSAEARAIIEAYAWRISEPGEPE